MGDKANTQSPLWLVYSASTTGNTGDRDAPHTMTKKACSARRHSKAAARASSHLTPLSRPPSKLPQCQLGTHTVLAHTLPTHRHYYITVRIYLSRNEWMRFSTLTRLFPLSFSLGSNSFLSLLTLLACVRATTISSRQNPLPFV